MLMFRMLQLLYGTLVAGRSRSLRVLIPLCGASKDINWLAEQGHCVIGVEFVELACRQFFIDHEIPFVEKAMNKDCTIFKSRDAAKNVTLFCCDFFSADKSIIGAVDAVWDRGSLTSIHPNDRGRYVETICQMLSPSTTYLIETLNYDSSMFGGETTSQYSMQLIVPVAGPPYSLPLDELTSLFAPYNSTVEQLSKHYGTEAWHKRLAATKNVFSITFHA
ncbi:hypothetical protein CAPTEDRAFT_203384 [Capitella teleta]|uniref:thiopurine S-methyltransferase n=1 Tax=Capitella teleta TaxID=283909 RepID=R7VA73_CAPTE|nr:hypothetical protein CAPTEDRAFT_203384 [Capitella teleta]|eukprot:ELU15437.1 hypothetical protein CAPTEDRAFT_203384 [Capitella teleta]